MNKNLFLQYVENELDCDAVLLDIAVQKGLRKAKSDRLDLTKLFGLVAACVVTAALCVTVNTSPFKAAAEGYFLDRSRMSQSSSDALDAYARDMANSVIKYLGDG